MAAIEYIAPIQPNALISRCSTGANTNWPKEPPALITPEAMPRDCGGNLLAATPISTEKLPAPEPTALSMPKVNTKPQPLCSHGVIRQPMANTTIPASNTGRAP